MEQPFLSCVCPTKNRRRFMAESLRRFLAQDYAGRTELVIVEDGDEDVSDLATCANVGFQKIRYFRHEATLGAKLNFGAQQARGEIIANWDDDDQYAPDRLRKQLAHMHLTGKPVVALSSFLCFREGDAHGWEYTGDGWYGGGATQMYRRDWALAHPHPDITMAEDVHYMRIAHASGDLSVMTGLDVLVVRDHSANTCPRDDKQLLGVTIDGHQFTCDNWRKVPLERIQAVIGR